MQSLGLRLIWISCLFHCGHDALRDDRSVDDAISDKDHVPDMPQRAESVAGYSAVFNVSGKNSIMDKISTSRSRRQQQQPAAGFLPDTKSPEDILGDEFTDELLLFFNMTESAPLLVDAAHHSDGISMGRTANLKTEKRSSPLGIPNHRQSIPRTNVSENDRQEAPLNNSIAYTNLEENKESEPDLFLTGQQRNTTVNGSEPSDIQEDREDLNTTSSGYVTGDGDSSLSGFQSGTASTSTVQETTTPPDDRKVVFIGGLFEKSGPYGVSEETAARLAISHINQRQILPGIRLDLLTNDTKVGTASKLALGDVYVAIVCFMYVYMY